MTHTTTQTEPARTPAIGTHSPLHPADILMNLIVALLAPMFLGAAAGDIGFARSAAIETVNAYRIRNHADLIAVAQIIGFGLAALGSLSLSMMDEISLSMTLRLRGNAVALNRSAEQNRRALRDPADAAPAAYQAEAVADLDPDPAAQESEAVVDADRQPEPAALLNQGAERQLAAEAEARLRDVDRPTPHPTPHSTGRPPAQGATVASVPMDKRHREMWAIAMVKEAGELHVSLPGLPPAERKTASMRIAALSSTAHDLLTGHRAPAAPAGRTVPIPPHRI
jgi:hypothetical protein